MRYLILFLALCASASAANFYYPVTFPVKQWYDKKGAPLSNGYIYFGVANQNPQASPITMYWDAAGLIPAVQPFRTSGGYIFRQGTPANVYAAGDFSCSVFTSSGTLVFTQPTSVDLQLALSIAGSSSAAAIPVADAGNYYTHPATVETAFAQLGPLLAQIVTALAGSAVTGEIKAYAGTAAPTGYCLLAGRTIGDASSGGTERANSDTSNLYVLVWNTTNTTSSAYPSIQDSSGTPTTRSGVGALTDFNNHRRLPLPDFRGRVIAGTDNMSGAGAAGRLTFSGSGIANTQPFIAAATETHAMTLGEIAAHNHTVNSQTTGITINSHTTGITAATNAITGAPGVTVTPGTGGGGASTVTITDPGHVHAITDPGHVHTTVNAGSNTPFSVVQPTITATYIIKL